MADIVLPVAYALKGSVHARRLWQYKCADAPPDDQATAADLLLALLLVFLRDHFSCVSRSAGSGPPTHVAVVPTARGRPGEHPLRSLIAPYLNWPWIDLSARPDQRERDLDPRRFSAMPVNPDSRVLLIDDTWTTGASAQSAAMALRDAGAGSVATVVIGRHVSGDSAVLEEFDASAMPFRMDVCAVHHGQDAVI